MNAAPRILAVDSNPRNLELLARFLQGQGYALECVSSLEQLDRQLGAAEAPPLALVDVGGFGREIWPRCRALRERGVPLLVVLPHAAPELEREGRANGALGLLVKPLAPHALLGHVQGLLLQGV